MNILLFLHTLVFFEEVPFLQNGVIVIYAMYCLLLAVLVSLICFAKGGVDTGHCGGGGRGDGEHQ